MEHSKSRLQSMIFTRSCDHFNTVGARILNARKPNPFENQTFYWSDLEWFGFRMVCTSTFTAGMDHSKTEHSKSEQ